MIIYGASGHGKVIIEILENIGTPAIEIWDDADRASVWEYPVKKPFSNDAAATDKVIVSIGVNATRKKVAEQLTAKNVRFGTAIHSDTHISKRAKIGEGTVVMAGVTINADTSVGSHCIINTSASIDHDCVLGNYVHISPNATLSGDVHVGEGTHIGSGASTIQGVRIGKWCNIGAGAVVIRDIPDFATAVGNPAKIIKINQNI
jgi:sugar O-acyltransferase (sialic acid O-acetyltransferase NeuD family)